MRFFTKIRAIVLGLAMVAGATGGVIATQVAPAAANDFGWNNTACWANYPVYSAVYPTSQAHFATYADVYIPIGGGDGGNPTIAGHKEGAIVVQAGIHSVYQQYGFECGFLGVVITNAYGIGDPVHGSGIIQYFIYPGTCDLRFAYWYYPPGYGGDGSKGVSLIAHYFC